MGAIHNTQHIESTAFANQTEERQKRARRLAAGIVAEYRLATTADKADITAIVAELVALTPKTRHRHPRYSA